ncbi:MAG: phosphate acyltransferase [Burkholderiales bacterium]|nr:phosphate acyltransferase [Burkholderiales bacterium]
MLASLFEARDWPYEYVGEDEISGEVKGSWTTYQFQAIWRSEDHVLQLLCLPDIRVTEPKRAALYEALALINERAPNLEIDGEMHGDAALSEDIRMKIFPNSRLKGQANLLIMPTLDAANISFNLLKTASGDGITVGPILLGAAKPVNVLTTSVTVRRIVNMTALTVADANAQRGEQRPLL